ncbi:MAG: LacI family DNA-binding transcriptional regulator [Mycobacteriales bacterium]
MSNSTDGPRRPTSKAVAEAAGVSRTSVSFAFNDPSRLSDATRTRILDAAKELGYRPDPVARMLVQGRTNSLGILLPQDIAQAMENPYYAQFIVGVGQVCHQEGYTLLLVPPLRNSMLEAIPYAAVDGFIVSGLERDRGEVAELERRGVPFVLVDSEATGDSPSVEVDDTAGAAAMMAHLLDLGHRRITILAFEAGPDRETEGYRGPLGRRIAGIDHTLAAAGLSRGTAGIDLVEVACTRAEGFKAGLDILARDERPTAVFALSDILAAGVLDAAYESGVSVPSDVSVAGFDDQPEAVWVRPRLTTVRQPIEAKGRVAADFLVSAIRGNARHDHQVLHTAVIVRESTAMARTSESHTT